MVCTQGPIDCRDCTLKAVCPYPYIFETAPFEGAQQLRTYGDVPRPFVIDPLDTRGEYRRGESFAFNLTLIGRAIDYLPYFLVSFRELGEIGIGKGRGRFQLTQVLTDDGEPIYDSDTQMVHNLNNTLSFDEIRGEAESLPTDALTVHLLTPTRITHKGHITDQLPFHIFWRRLIGRISALAYFHCGESLDLDFKGLIAQAETVQTVQSKLTLARLDALLFTPEPEDEFGGLIGSTTYAGDLAAFSEFLALGVFVHVGKNSTFGLGKYRVGERGEIR